MTPTKNTAAPTTALGFNPLQLPQVLAEAITATPATVTVQQQLQRAQTVYRGTYPAPRPQMLTRSASATTLGVTLIKSRLNWEPVGGETLMYFHHGLNEWRKFPSEEMVGEDDVLEAKESSTRLRKRDMLRKIFSLKPRGGKSGGEKKGLIISGPVDGSARYNEL